MNSDQLNSVSGTVLDSAIAVHRVLGPGLLESAYRACLAFELRNRGLGVMSEVPLPVVYEGHKLEVGYRIDLLVAKEVVVEVKAVEGIAPIQSRATTYRLTIERQVAGTAPQLQCGIAQRRCRPHAQRVLTIHHRGTEDTEKNRIDLLVAKEVVVEVKAIEGIAQSNRAQLLTDLRLSGKSLGLLLNFNVALLKDGVVRMRNGY